MRARQVASCRFPNSRIRSQGPLARRGHGNGQWGCHISAIRGREAARPTPQRRRQLRSV